MAKAIPIALGVSRGGAGAPASPVPLPVKKEVLARDGDTCRCCGFKAAKYQEVVHLNRDPTDNRPANLAAVCIFCHQCFYMERVGPQQSGVLLWLPEIPQAHLHHIARAAYVGRITQGDPMAAAARKALEVFMTRREVAKTRVGTEDRKSVV